MDWMIEVWRKGFMEYRNYGNTIYARMDRGDEIISGILEICKQEKVYSAVFSGIGGCSTADIQTFIPATGEFELQHIEGMLELIAIHGNVVTDDQGQFFHHTHAIYSYKENGEHHLAAGHMKATNVLYTAEIEIRPVIGGMIKRKYDEETGTGFWKFED